MSEQSQGEAIVTTPQEAGAMLHDLVVRGFLVQLVLTMRSGRQHARIDVYPIPGVARLDIESTGGEAWPDTVRRAYETVLVAGGRRKQP